MRMVGYGYSCTIASSELLEKLLMEELLPVITLGGPSPMGPTELILG